MIQNENVGVITQQSTRPTVNTIHTTTTRMSSDYNVPQFSNNMYPHTVIRPNNRDHGYTHRK